MLLAVDIGNTNIVAGVFDGEKLIGRWRIATDTRRTPDEHAILLESLFRSARLDIERLTGVIICDVVPPVRASVCEAVNAYWNLEPLIVSPTLDLGIPVRYMPPNAVGADRIANAVAAINRYPLPAIVVDFGTATTFDAISQEGAYVGGAIAPGLEISEEALFAHTAQLPRVSLDAPRTAVGTSTVESLRSGIMYGYAGLVDGLVERFRAELGQDACVVATGGLARTVAPHTRCVRVTEPDLTLHGLRLLYIRNDPHARSPGSRED